MPKAEPNLQSLQGASWVVVKRVTGRPVFETFSRKIAAAINLEKYEVLPIGEWLAWFNAQIKAGTTDPRRLTLSEAKDGAFKI